MAKIKITAVSYLNTKPFLYGIFKSQLDDLIHLELDVPSRCAEKLENGEADLGLIPVAAIATLASPYLISDFCIGCNGPVKTVCLFGDRPLEEMDTILLDYQSRTSVELLRILLDKHWKKSPTLVNAQPGFVEHIKGRTGALVIGDRAITLAGKHPFVYDLGEAWMELTGLPFVFAAWISNRPLDEAFIEKFNEALAVGLDFIPQLIYLMPTPEPGFDLNRYFTQYISYPLDKPKMQALSLFLNHLGVKNLPSFFSKARTV